MESTSSSSLPQTVVMLFGIVVCVLSIWAMINPARLRQVISVSSDNPRGYQLAVAVRLLLGITLIIAAADSRFPTVFELIGWVTIIAALILVLIGQEPQRRLAAWFSGLPDGETRAWLVLGVAFGVFLVFGVTRGNGI